METIREIRTRARNYGDRETERLCQRALAGDQDAEQKARDLDRQNHPELEQHQDADTLGRDADENTRRLEELANRNPDVERDRGFDPNR